MYYNVSYTGLLTVSTCYKTWTRVALWRVLLWFRTGRFFLIFCSCLYSNHMIPQVIFPIGLSCSLSDRRRIAHYSQKTVLCLLQWRPRLGFYKHNAVCLLAMYIISLNFTFVSQSHFQGHYYQLPSFHRKYTAFITFIFSKESQLCNPVLSLAKMSVRSLIGRYVSTLAALVDIMAWRRRRQAIIWSNYGLVYWCIHASLGLNELKFILREKASHRLIATHVIMAWRVWWFICSILFWLISLGLSASRLTLEDTCYNRPITNGTHHHSPWTLSWDLIFVTRRMCPFKADSQLNGLTAGLECSPRW